MQKTPEEKYKVNLSVEELKFYIRIYKNNSKILQNNALLSRKITTSIDVLPYKNQALYKYVV